MRLAQEQLRRTLFIAVVTLALAGAGIVVTNGRLVVSGWHLYECGGLAGSWPAEFADEIGLRSGLEIGELVTVERGGLTYVATEVSTITNQSLGIGVWVAGDQVERDQIGAVDEVARRWSRRTSRGSKDDGAARAARRCLRQKGA